VNESVKDNQLGISENFCSSWIIECNKFS